jgi:hypothetical protein
MATLALLIKYRHHMSKTQKCMSNISRNFILPTTTTATIVYVLGMFRFSRRRLLTKVTVPPILGGKLLCTVSGCLPYPDIPPYYFKTLHFVEAHGASSNPLLVRYCLQHIFLWPLALLFIIIFMIPYWLTNKAVCVTFLVPIYFQIDERNAKKTCQVHG